MALLQFHIVKKVVYNCTKAVLCSCRRLDSQNVQHGLREEPLLQRLEEMLLEQLPACSDERLGQAAFALAVFAQRGFRPSDELLTALDAELLSRVANARQTARLAGCLADVLSLLSSCARSASASLQERTAAWFLGIPCDSVRRQTSKAGAQLLKPTQAKGLLRAWLMFAATPGTTANATLPAVLRMLDDRNLCDFARGGAAGVLQRALTDQLTAAPSVQARAAFTVYRQFRLSLKPDTRCA